jgi:hypothetical protein
VKFAELGGHKVHAFYESTFLPVFVTKPREGIRNPKAKVKISQEII